VYLLRVGWRADVENLFLMDRLPPEVETVVYETMEMRRCEVEMNVALSIRNELRAQLVARIIDTAMGIPELQPFDLLKAHEVMANRDISLNALLVRPDFVPLLDKIRRPILGIKVKVFAHDEVPPGDVYGLTEPQFLGSVARSTNGTIGIALTNPDGIVWGRFPPRRYA
jgi:hypothetical protein